MTAHYFDQIDNPEMIRMDWAMHMLSEQLYGCKQCAAVDHEKVSLQPFLGQPFMIVWDHTVSFETRKMILTFIENLFDRPYFHIVYCAEAVKCKNLQTKCHFSFQEWLIARPSCTWVFGPFARNLFDHNDQAKPVQQWMSDKYIVFANGFDETIQQQMQKAKNRWT